MYLTEHVKIPVMKSIGIIINLSNGLIDKRVYSMIVTTLDMTCHILHIDVGGTE